MVDVSEAGSYLRRIDFCIECLGFGEYVFSLLESHERDLEVPPLHRKVDVRLPGKVNSNSRGARPVHLIITMIKWIRTSRSSIKNSLSAAPAR